MKQTTNHQNPNFEQLPMQINVKIYRPSVKGPILADASVNLNGCFAIRGVQVKEGRNGPFVSMPSRQVKGEYRDICFPCTPEFKQPTGWSWIRGSASARTGVRSRTGPKWAACPCNRKERAEMKRKLALCAAVLCLTMALSPSAFAAESVVISQSSAPPEVCYPTSVSRSEDGTEIRKYYDLGPEEDPAGIPRSDFEQDGFRYTLIDLLKQELPENESRQHTETVSLESKSKDMESVLALLPQEKEFITEDGLSGVLTLQLDTVQVEVAGYGSSTREVSATRSYPNLASQDTANIPKTIEDNGRTLTLQNISWQTDNTANTDGYAMGDRFTAVATYTGSATSSYVTGYTVTADYSGTVSRIALNKTRYVAIFEGTAIEPLVPLPDSGSSPVQFNWAYILVPLGVVFAAGGVIGGCLLYKRKHESEEETE